MWQPGNVCLLFALTSYFLSRAVLPAVLYSIESSSSNTGERLIHGYAGDLKDLELQEFESKVKHDERPLVQRVCEHSYSPNGR